MSVLKAKGGEIRVAAPVTRINVENGKAVGVALADGEEIAVDRAVASEVRGQYRTPVANVFLCGSGSHPGGGVSMAPGRNAARVILADVAGRG